MHIYKIGTRNTDNFCQVLSCSIRFQSITDTQGASKSFAASQRLEIRNEHQYICTNCGQSGGFPSSFQSSQTDMDCIPWKMKSAMSEPFIDFWGPCSAHPMSSHTWQDYFNNSKNKTLEGQHDTNHNNGNHYGSGHFYVLRGWGCGQERGHYIKNTPCCPSPSPLFITNRQQQMHLQMHYQLLQTPIILPLVII